MVTISLCMIVKNEEQRLGKCLDSLQGIYDELLIADTGSSDRTKEVAAKYGAKVFDFQWCDDFAAARNFIGEKATCDYIYSADADEELDPENRKKFLQLKEILDPEIDIVQMYYMNQTTYRTVYNFDRELRPKLYKRVRTFTWISPIHETLRTEPLVFDSDIEIIHRPADDHAARDLAAFRRAVDSGMRLDERLFIMYARELYMAGEADDLKMAAPYMDRVENDPAATEDMKKAAVIILERAAFAAGDIPEFLSNALYDIACGGTAEVCCDLGNYYETIGQFENARAWFEVAAQGAYNILDASCSGDRAEAGVKRLSLKLENL